MQRRLFRSDNRYWRSLLESTTASITFWWILALVLAAILAWAGRNAMNPDGLSYLDIASRVNQNGPSELINIYWSPGYPALIALSLFVLRPTPELEFAVIHILNWLIFALALGAFTFFLRGFLTVSESDAPDLRSDRAWLLPFGFSLFLFFVLTYIGMDLVSPDLLVATTVLLLAGVGCRMVQSDSASWKPYLALGAILAVGYYVKAILFPLGFIFLALLWVTLPKVRRLRLLVSTAVFLTMSTPLITLVSRRAGHPTISDVSRLAYLWYTNRRDLLRDGWTWNGKFGSALPLLAHPPRVLISSPRTLEFREPIPGTLPVWYEPAYWWAGFPMHFDLGQQLASIRRSLHSLFEIFDSMTLPATGALILLFLRRPAKLPPGRNLAVPRLVLWWSVAACGLYALMWIERRYLGGFSILFWLGAFGMLLPRTPRMVNSAVLGALSCALIVITVASVERTAARARQRLADEPRSDEQIIAASLLSLGIGPGSRLALAGVDFGPYYARIARARVVAQIEDDDAFWRLDVAARRRVEAELGTAGIAAIVARNRPLGAVLDGWIEVPLPDASPFNILPLVNRR
jgi:hypothetical protein